MLTGSREHFNGLTALRHSLLPLLCIVYSTSVSVYGISRHVCRTDAGWVCGIQPAPTYRWSFGYSTAFVPGITYRNNQCSGLCNQEKRNAPYCTSNLRPLQLRGFSPGGGQQQQQPGPAVRPTYGPRTQYNTSIKPEYGLYNDSAYSGNEFNRYRGTFPNAYAPGTAGPFPNRSYSPGHPPGYVTPVPAPYGPLPYAAVPYANYNEYTLGPGSSNGPATAVGEWAPTPNAGIPMPMHLPVQEWYPRTPKPYHRSHGKRDIGWNSRPAAVNRAFDPYANATVKGGVYGSERLQNATEGWTKTTSDPPRISSGEFFRSFRPYPDILWLNDHTSDDEWPGASKLKYGETFDGLIRHWLTPLHAVLLTVDKMAECCLVTDGMPTDYARPNLRSHFKVDHVIQAKLKWPQEFDDKGRPKVVLSYDRQDSPNAYVLGDFAWGTPLLLKENLAILRLDRGDHLGLMYLSELGVELVDIKTYSFSQFLEKGERIQVQIVRMPSFPKVATYLARVPWDSPKRLEWAEKFPEIKESIAPYSYGNLLSSRSFAPEIFQPKLYSDHYRPQQGDVGGSTNELDGYTYATKHMYTLLPTPGEPQTISEFTRKIGGKLKDILRFLFLQTKTPINPDANLTVNLAKTIYNFVAGRTEFNDIDVYIMEDELEHLKERSVVKSLERPPIVVLMGHINHGKTSLFDMLTESNNIDSEPGQITQTVRTQMLTGDCPMTLIDTPGHEVFDAMRRCGATIADIALIVVDSMEGLRKQTRESIKLCKNLSIPFIIAATKCDLPNAQQRAEDLAVQLSEEGVTIEGLGGDTQFLQVSAKEDIDNSRNTILNAVMLQSAVTDDRVVTDVPGTIGRGFVLESGKGSRSSPYCLAILKQGTMAKGSYFVSGKTSVKIKNLKTPSGKRVTNAKPSQAVLIDGFEDGMIPTPGDAFVIYKEEEHAECITEHNIETELEKAAARELQREIYKGIDVLQDRETDDPSVKRVPVILKSTTQGSVEALKHAISTVVVPGMMTTGTFEIVDASTGSICKSDIISAHDSNAIILGLDSAMKSDAKAEAKKHNVTVIVSDVIYDILEKSRDALKERLGDRILSDHYGSARVLKVFDAARNAKAAGCVVSKGRIPKNSAVRVLRHGKPVYSGTLESLRHTTDSVDQAVESQSCGMIFKGWNDVQVDDIVEAYAP